MAKEYKWKVTIDGQEHEILCVPSNNRYHIYDNEEYVTAVYRKLFSDLRGGLDEVITIAGKPCHFVIWDGRPDLEVDGKLLRTGGSYQEGREKFQKSMKFVAIWFLGWALFDTLYLLVNPDIHDFVSIFIKAVFGGLFLWAWFRSK